MLRRAPAIRSCKSAAAKRVVGSACAALASLGAVLAGIAALAPASALASRSQVAIFEDDSRLLADPVGTLQEMRHLGVGMVRVLLRWSSFAPDPASPVMPNFNATDPNAYPEQNWAALDAAVLDAEAAGIQVMLDPTGFAPRWAQGPDPGRYGGKYDIRYAWEPSAREYGEFVQAVGERYSGTFVPPGSSTPLPRVSVWEIYNEPNFGEDLAPQALNGSRLMHSPQMYRQLADAAWAGLQATGHVPPQDQVIIGSLLANGFTGPVTRSHPQGLPGTYGGMKPLVFVRELYCLNSHYRRYLGHAAYLRGCPTTAAGYASFRSQHPVLFHATGFSDHPYSFKGRAPNRADSSDQTWTDLNEIPHLAKVLDRIQRLYRSGTHFPIWNTEYGYITCPPNCGAWHPVSPKTAAAYINWAEYLSWRDPRLVSTMQYLLYDPNPVVGVPEHGGFASGLVFYGGTPKPIYYAYRMPIFLPHTRARRGRGLRVWGDVRPAPLAVADGDGPQSVQIQFARGSSHKWRTLKTLSVIDPRGYINTRVAFPASGSVRLSWTYPPSDKRLTSTMVINSNGLITSRAVRVTITG